MDSASSLPAKREQQTQIAPDLSFFDYVCPETRDQAAKARILCDIALNQTYTAMKHISDGSKVKPLTANDAFKLAMVADTVHNLCVGLTDIERRKDEGDGTYRNLYADQAKAAKEALNQIKRQRREEEKTIKPLSGGDSNGVHEDTKGKQDSEE